MPSKMLIRIGDMKKILRYCGLVALSGAALYLPSCDDDGGREAYTGPWKKVKTPSDIGVSVGEIQFLSKTDGWAIAGKNLLKLKGKEWVIHKKILHPDPLADYGFGGFHMLSEREGWFVGPEWLPDPRGGGRTISHSTIWRFDGDKFTAVKHPDKEWLGTVWFNNADDGWAFGHGALHYSNGEWKEVELKDIVIDCFFFGEDDGWAVSGVPGGSIWRWDGVTWSRVFNCGLFEYFGCIAFDKPGSGWAGIFGPWTGGPHMYRYDGKRWDYSREKFEEDVIAIDFYGPNYGCAVGGEALIFEDGVWVPTADPKAVFWSVECVGPNDIWAGSDAGEIYHFTGFN